MKLSAVYGTSLTTAYTKALNHSNTERKERYMHSICFWQLIQPNCEILWGCKLACPVLVLLAFSTDFICLRSFCTHNGTDSDFLSNSYRWTGRIQGMV